MNGLIRPGDTLTGFFIQEDRCFRMIASPQIQATHCARPARWRGRFTDAVGREHLVWGCDAHAEVLRGVRPVYSH
jgi:hypothetical protein